MSQRAVAAPSPSLGTTGQADWETVPLTDGSSVIAALRARGIPATREVLAAVAQVNGIRDFRHIAAGTPIWLPRRESLTGERAQVWREAYQALTPDSFASVDRDRAARGRVRPRPSDGPHLATPRRGPPRQGEEVVDAPLAPDEQGPLVDQGPPGPRPITRGPPSGGIIAPIVDGGPAPGPRQDIPEGPGPTVVVDPDPSASAVRAANGPANAEQRMEELVRGLRGQLEGARDRETILGLVYGLMASPYWTNQQARRKYAELAGNPANEWQLIADLRASGLSSRDVLRASEYVWNDESTPFDGDVSAPIRVVLAAVGHTQRGIGEPEAASGTADASFEDALWEIVNTVGVDTANAIIASRAGANPAGMFDSLRFSHDPANPGILGRVRDMLQPSRAPAPLDGSLQPPPPGTNPLVDIVNTEYSRWKNPLGGFSGAQRDRMLAILRMPPGTDRRAFDTAMAATEARGEDFLKLFEGKSREQIETIQAAFDAGFGRNHHGNLGGQALAILDADQMLRFQALMTGTKSDANAAARYIALTLRARAGDKDGMRAVLRLLGSTESGTPRWADVVEADFALNPQRAQQRSLEAVLGDLANDPMVQVIVRDGANPDEPAGIARRVLASNEPREIQRLLKRTDGDYFNDQELAIMVQTAGRSAGGADAVTALLRHVAQVCGENSEAAMILRRASGQQTEAPLYDSTGRLAPAAQLFFALQRGDSDTVSTLLSRTPFVALSGLEADYPAVAAFLGQAGARVPGNTNDIRAAIRGALRGEERDRALRFLTGFNVASPEAAGQSGEQLAAAITADLESRCAWLLRELDHEREPLRERLMQFRVSLAQVLAGVEERRKTPGQDPQLTEDEIQRLGEAVRRLVGQRKNFEVERDQLARNIQDTTILVSTAVASIAISVATFGAGTGVSAALWTTALNIATVAGVGTAAGALTAPLQGNANRWITGPAKGFAYGFFTGVGASTPQLTGLLARAIPGTGLMATTARNGIVMSTVWGGLSASGNIGTEFDSTGEMIRRVGGDYLRGAAFGLGFAGVMGFMAWLSRLGAGAQPTVEALNDTVARYHGARDLASAEQAFGVLSGGKLPPPGFAFDIPASARAELAQGFERHLAMLARTPATTVAEITEKARWLTTITLYADAAGIQLHGEALGNAMRILQQTGVRDIPARLTETNARRLLLQTAERLRNGDSVLRAPVQAARGPAPGSAPGPRVSPAAASPGPLSGARSWADMSNAARQAGGRPMPLQAALQTREQLTRANALLGTPQGNAALQRELGAIAPRDLAQLRQAHIAAMSRVDQQIAANLRSEAAQLARIRVPPTGDNGPLFDGLLRLQWMNQQLGILRNNGMTRELFDATSAQIGVSRHGIDTMLSARVRETFANPGLDPRGMLGTVVQFRDTMVQQGFAQGAPQTMRAFNEAVQRLQAAAARVRPAA